jgi:hypothetical protein
MGGIFHRFFCQALASRGFSIERRPRKSVKCHRLSYIMPAGVPVTSPISNLPHFNFRSLLLCTGSHCCLHGSFLVSEQASSQLIHRCLHLCSLGQYMCHPQGMPQICLILWGTNSALNSTPVMENWETQMLCLRVPILSDPTQQFTWKRWD